MHACTNAWCVHAHAQARHVILLQLCIMYISQCVPMVYLHCIQYISNLCSIQLHCCKVFSAHCNLCPFIINGPWVGNDDTPPCTNGTTPQEEKDGDQEQENSVASDGRWMWNNACICAFSREEAQVLCTSGPVGASGLTSTFCFWLSLPVSYTHLTLPTNREV